MKKGKCAVLMAVVLLITACQTAQQPETSADTTVIVGATVIDGRSDTPIENAVLVIEGATIRNIGAQGSIELPANAQRIDATGKTIMPGMFNLHGHVALSDGMERGTQYHTRERIQQDVNAYLYYGITHVASLGINQEPLQGFLEDQREGRAGGARVHSGGLGFAAKDGWRPADVETINRPTTPDEARAMVRNELAKNAEVIKIWVDDNQGELPKITPELYGAIIDEAHQNNLKVLAHMYTLKDAKELIRRGIDALAHSVRDEEVDEEFLTLAKASGVTQIPTLVGHRTSLTYAENPDFLNDPALPLLFPASVLDVVRTEQYQRRSAPALERTRQRYETAARNTMKVAAAGIPIAVGTDSQGAGRFQGLWEHIEMELLVEAGLTSMDAIRAATVNSAKFLGVENRFGTLEPGKVADFIVLNSDPLSDISNSRDIDAVWMNGQPIDRSALTLAGNSGI